MRAIKFLLLLAFVFTIGCQQPTKRTTWADLPDGSKEYFDFTPEDCVFVRPGIFYVVSPSGIKVYFGGPRAYRLDPELGRVPINPFTGEDLVWEEQ